MQRSIICAFPRVGETWFEVAMGSLVRGSREVCMVVCSLTKKALSKGWSSSDGSIFRFSNLFGVTVLIKIFFQLSGAVFGDFDGPFFRFINRTIVLQRSIHCYGASLAVNAPNSPRNYALGTGYHSIKSQGRSLTASDCISDVGRFWKNFSDHHQLRCTPVSCYR